MRKVLTFAALFIMVAATSCKKNGAEPDPTTPVAPAVKPSAFDLMRDSVFLYAKEAYYWNDGLPDSAAFKPRSFTGTSDLNALAKEVDALSQYKINPATGKPYEYYASSPGEAKYSFIDGGETSTELGGAKADFGFAPLYIAVDDLRIKYVYAGSAAGLAGIKRGYKVITINGNSNITYDNGGTRTQFVANAFFNSNSITLVLERPDFTRFTTTLNASGYTTNPVINYKIIDTGNGHKVGYFVFASFTSPANATAKLDEAFNYFSSNGVTDLVVDLRYNGGGYVSTAEYLSNLIVPAAKNNTVMYSTYFNNILTSGKAKLLANQVRRDPTTNQKYNYAQFDYTVEGNAVPFSKKGSLNLNSTSNVFFIVGSGTASASELVINNLKPVVNVKLIGSTTYGKPVGFFDIRINKYEMYIPEFETKNSLAQGGYYTGMEPESATYPGKKGTDDVSRDFGDPEEALFKQALNYVKNGTFSAPQQQVLSNSKLATFSLEQSVDAAKALDAGGFSGMIYDKPLKLK
ncbi:S41 family peptidase [Mucilaginibacter calamicampi]|uniref:S41 family peptidase n=1 Tax=Mucilaginibacter calamicampi TaxID=1302352 RepID=A0ABW2YY79_9SPHI